MAQKQLALRPRFGRWYVWVLAVLAMTSAALLTLSFRGVSWLSGPRFPDAPIDPRFPVEMRWHVTVAQGHFILSNRASGPRSGFVTHVRHSGIAPHWLWPRGPSMVAVEHAPVGGSTWAVQLYIPLWIPLLVGAGGCAWYYLGTRARRRIERGLCGRCAYSRAGLLANERCPECGHVPVFGPRA